MRKVLSAITVAMLAWATPALGQLAPANDLGVALGHIHVTVKDVEAQKKFWTEMLGGKLDKPDAAIKPAGLGARDTLRLEAGMPLYGHELTETLDPISAGLGWAVDLAKPFIGVDALRVIQQKGPARKLVGLELEGKPVFHFASNSSGAANYHALSDEVLHRLKLDA